MSSCRSSSTIWPDTEFGDFDHSLNIAVNKIRQALGDSSDTPRFIETLPRRGYRFIAQVDVPETPVAPGAKAHWRKQKFSSAGPRRKSGEKA
jgi:DNA-binding winged helix-turn-helix (wHTH) protein